MEAAIDFTAFQEVLDPIFHTRDDAYPAGSTEHSEVYQFVTKLEKLQRSRAPAQEPSPESKAAAEKLGIPATYDPRYCINVSILPDQQRIRKGLKAVRRRAEQLATSTGVLHDAEQVVTRYSRLLPFYEDFYQKKHFAKLAKLEQDRAALPISVYQNEIVEAIRANQAVLIAGNTGCGKSTQVPQYLVNAGFKNVVCTQPRRISAISLCRRVSFETLNVYGSEVAYQVRFNSTASDNTRVVFMTEGILLRIMASDPQLSRYDVVIVDEVHERHLNTDFLLTLLRALLIQRPTFRVVLMSATINHQMYSDFFGGAPVIQVPGRLYPVELEYVKLQKKEAAPPDRNKPGNRRGGKASNQQTAAIDPGPYLRLLQRIDTETPSTHRGDMLVFVAGMSDITRLKDALQPYAQQTQRWVVLPLHSTLPLKEQDRVFDAAPQGVRKCIISTNIAETSVTIDGIRFVVDSGRAKQMLHDITSGGGSLQEGWISQASAEQRKGRAGRTGPGKCFRMYSKEEFEKMVAFSLPEIRRVRLENVVLQIKALAGSGMNPRSFGFIEPPPEDVLEAAITTLYQVGAITKMEELTSLGVVLSALPVEVHVGKMLVLGALLHIIEPLLTIAAALSVQSPFMRLSDDDGPGARERRREIQSPDGDAFTLLNAFEAWLSVKADGSSSMRWCKRRGLQEQRLYELSKLKRQFQDLLEDSGLVQLSGFGGKRKRRIQKPMGRDKTRLLELQRTQEHKRMRRTLAVPGNKKNEGGNEEGERGENDLGTDESGGDDEDSDIDIDDIDFRMQSSMKRLLESAGTPFTHSDLNLLKCILACSLYPRVAVADERNSQRREQDARFHTPHCADVVLHPASCLSGNATAISSQEVIMYTDLLDTTRQYIGGNTPCRAVPILLLAALQVDTDASASRMLLDGWLLVRFHDDSGPMVLRRVLAVRHAMNVLLTERLKRVRLPNVPAASSPLDESMLQDMEVKAEQGEQVAPLARILQEDVRSPTKLSEDDVAAELAASVDWPVRYSVERLFGQKVTAQYIIQGDPADVARDLMGVPKQKAGCQVSSWLRVGSLKRFMGERSLHILQPHLKRHWLCPGCFTPLLANASEIQEHVNICERALLLPQEILEIQGYQDGAAAVQANTTSAVQSINPNDRTSTPPIASMSQDGGHTEHHVVVKSEPGMPSATLGSIVKFEPDLGLAVAGASAAAVAAAVLTQPEVDLETAAAELSLSDPDMLHKVAIRDVKWGRRRPPPRPESRGNADKHEDEGRRYAARDREAAPGRDGAHGNEAVLGDVVYDPHGNEAVISRDGLISHDDVEALGADGGVEWRSEVSKDKRAFGSGTSMPGNTRQYRCALCGLDEWLTPVQILQHKRSHAVG